MMFCSYCGKTEKERTFIKKQSVFKRLYAKHGIKPKLPICAKCYGLLKAGKLCKDVQSPSDAAVLEEIKAVKSMAAGLSKMSELRHVLSLFDRIEILQGHLRSVEVDFQKAADLARQYAAKMETIESALTGAKSQVEEKFKANYHHCRRVADQSIKDPVVRATVFSRDGNKCKHCGTTEYLAVDHVIPVRLGGSNELNNLQTLCIRCNSAKGAKIQEAA